ncbi:MAG: EamA family transporter RarD [Pirellula sp.]
MYIFQALSAFVLWGIFPLYWKFLKHVDPLEIICHRILWSLLTLCICVTWLGQWSDIRDALKNPRRVALAALAAVLISINWLVFIWAVLNQAVVDSSLGYFINPLVSVVLGVVLFHERLGRLQWLAVAIAGSGLLMSAMSSERLWVSIALAISFAFYGVVKKQTKLPAVSGLGMETAILAPIAVVYLAYLFWQQPHRYSSSTLGLLALGGPVTTLPLLLFASSSKHVPLVLMGMLQYVGPTLQFALGAWFDREPLDQYRVAGFCCVWIALAIFSGVAFYQWQREKRVMSKSEA